MNITIRIMANIKFEKISLVQKALILSFESDECIEISLTEIDKIYLTVNKLAPLYLFSFIVISLIVIGFAFWFENLIVILIFAIILIGFGAVKIHNYKQYGITIGLKNGDFIKQQVPLKLKYEAIDFVNKIRKELSVF